jgi:pilus assembly protein TadC
MKMSEERKSNRLKRFLMLLVSPVVGLVYVIALPFIAVVTFVGLVSERIIGGLINVVGKSISYGWRPTESYLLGRKRKGKRKK